MADHLFNESITIHGVLILTTNATIVFSKLVSFKANLRRPVQAPSPSGTHTLSLGVS